jgi:FkbM family methyltransferase
MKIKHRAIKKYRKDGAYGIIKRIPSFVVEESFPHRKKLAGKIIELRGNLITYNDIKLDLSNENLSTQLKGRFWFGEYEEDESRLVDDYLPQDKPVIELGGCIGLTACKINKKLEKPGKHVVLEANPNLISSLERNKELNEAKFEIINKAYDPEKKEVEFYIHDKFVGGSVQRETDKQVKIEAINIQKILENKGWDEAVLICDIEGGEYKLLDNKSELQGLSLAIVETHNFVDSPEKPLKDFKILDSSESVKVLNLET